MPAGGDIQSTAETSDEPVTIVVYAGRDASFTLYDDEGTNYNYEKGAYAKIPLTWNQAASTLTIGAREGSFEGMRDKLKFNVVLVDEAHPLGEAIMMQGKTVTYSGKAVTVKL